jgi:tetratricopeptide (TPR) repeat protein
MCERWFQRRGNWTLLLIFIGTFGIVGWIWRGAVHDSGVNFLASHAGGKWILYPSPPSLMEHPRIELWTTFRRAFRLPKEAAKASLRVAGLERFSVTVNGTELRASEPPKNWKKPQTFEISTLLRVGENQIAATVFSSNGPPALWLALDAPDCKLGSDEGWEVSCAGATWRLARLATKAPEIGPGNPAYGGEAPWPSLKKTWFTILLFGCLSGACVLLGRFLLRSGGAAEHSRRRVDAVLFAGLIVLWVALFANNLGELPPLTGYDVDGHVAYIRYLQQHHALPTAQEGWEMFQPPLYYAISAVMLDLLDLKIDEPGAIIALRGLGFVIGVGQIAIVWAALRLLFEQRSAARWGVLLAAFLSPALYLAQYVSNEAMAALLVSGSFYLCLLALKQQQARWKTYVGLGLCLGAAMLAKSSSVLAVAAVAASLSWKAMTRIESANGSGRVYSLPSWREAAGIGLVLGASALVCGWHYLAVWRKFGNPLIGVWDPRTGFSWWQDEGYRTSAYYLRFGPVFANPWLAALSSFGDGIYSTLWGDGSLGGAASIEFRPPWNNSLMAAGYWLAIVPTISILGGAVLILRRFARDGSALWFLLLSFAFLMAFALVDFTLHAPYYCAAKAFYVLSGLIPLCAFGAEGFGALCRRKPKMGLVLASVYGAWALTSYASFWIVHSSPATVCAKARALYESGHTKEGVRLLEDRLVHDPHSAEMRRTLIQLLEATGDSDAAERNSRALIEEAPAHFAGYLSLSRAISKNEGQLSAAVEAARRAVELAPQSEAAGLNLATLLAWARLYDQTIAAASDGLGLAPFNADLRFVAGYAFVNLCRGAEAISQLELAIRLKRDWPEANYELALAYELEGLTSRAIEQLNEALRLKPNYVKALDHLALIRAAKGEATFRDGTQAIQLAEWACHLTEDKDAQVLLTLAAAYAEADRFDEAVTAGQKARALAVGNSQKQLVDKSDELLKLFSSRLPYRLPGTATK